MTMDQNLCKQDYELILISVNIVLHGQLFNIADSDNSSILFIGHFSHYFTITGQGNFSLKLKILYFWNKANGGIHFWNSLNTKIEKFSKKMKFFTSYSSKSNCINFEFDGPIFPIIPHLACQCIPSSTKVQLPEFLPNVLQCNSMKKYSLITYINMLLL